MTPELRGREVRGYSCGWWIVSLALLAAACVSPVQAGSRPQFAGGGGTAAGRALAAADCEEWSDLGGGVRGVGAAFPIFALVEFRGDLIAGGSFTQIGGQTVNRIARWDGAAWHPLVEGGQPGLVGEDVRALAVHEGDLIVGGTFTTAGGQTVNRIARWDGTAWHPFVVDDGGIGMSGPVHALAIYEGDLIAGGPFVTAGGVTVNRIARWNGRAWLPFVREGNVGVSGTVSALLTRNDHLVVGGSFLTAGGLAVNNIARWDGSTWQPFLTNTTRGVIAPVFALAEFEGNLVAAGQFGSAGGVVVNSIAWRDEIQGTWRPFGAGMNLSVFTLAVHDGDLVAGGLFTTTSDGGQVLNRIARWPAEGTAWSAFIADGEIGMSSAGSSVRALLGRDGALIAAGAFATAGGRTVDNIARWGICAAELSPTPTSTRTATSVPPPSASPSNTPPLLQTSTRTPTPPAAASATPTPAGDRSPSPTPTASPTTTPEVDVPPFGDANCDGQVTASDLTALIEALAVDSRAPCMLDDVNGDGVLDAGDLTALFAAIFAS